MPALQVSFSDPIFIGDLCGFILSLPAALLLSLWIGSGSIRHPAMGALGAFLGALFGFLTILGWVGTLIFSTPLPGANGVTTFFGSLLLCSALGVAGCIFTDRAIMHRDVRAYRSRDTRS
jgi:hypothetical protein